jgi:hypothetical protein
VSSPRAPATSRGISRERAGRAFLVEDRDRRGLFHGSWQADDEERERLEPTDERTALAWARERADVVVIRLFESMPYSAGDVNAWGGPEWPGLEAARANPNMTPPPD